MDRLEMLNDLLGGDSGALLFTSNELSWLGGSEAAVDTLREHDTYAKMEFRSLWNQEIPSGFYFPDPIVQQQFTQIWSGDFSAEYQLSVSKPYKFCLTVYVSSESLDAMIIKTVFDQTVNLSVDCRFSMGFDKNTSATMMKALAYQILHQFLRQHGGVLEDDELDQLTEHLRVAYMEKFDKPYMQVLDLVMSRLDIALAREPKNNGKIAALHLEPAQMLQASGKYQLAAHMFATVGEKFANKQSARFYVDAAQSFKCGKKYAEAEAFLLKALRTNMEFGGRGIVVTSDMVTNGANSGLLDTYSQWHGKLNSGNDGDDDKSQISLVYHTYIGLLHVCNYRAYQDQDDRKLIERFNSTMLQGKYKKVKEAKKVLADALASENADDFRAKVLSCLKGSTGPYVPLKSLGACEKGVEGKKRHVRKFLKGTHAICSRCCACGAPETEQQALKNCPCRSEKYCSKKCQLTHWKQHKRFCAFHQQKKQGIASKSTKK